MLGVLAGVWIVGQLATVLTVITVASILQGVSAADAGIIADDFASTVKRTEDRPGLSTTHVAAPDPEPA